MVRRADLERSLPALADHQLLSILGPRASDYSEIVVEVATEEAMARGIGGRAPAPHRVGPDLPPPIDRTIGPRGWLGWALILPGMAPGLFVAAGALLWAVSEAPTTAAGALGAAYGFVGLLSALCAAWLNAEAGKGPEHRGRAVQRSLDVFAAFAVLNGVGFALAPSPWRFAALGGLALSVLAFFYLRRSRRVYRTYAGWRDHVKTRGDRELKERHIFGPLRRQAALAAEAADAPGRVFARRTSARLTAGASERTYFADIIASMYSGSDDEDAWKTARLR